MAENATQPLPAIPRRSALDGQYHPGDFGAIKGQPGITIAERRGLAMVHLDCWDDSHSACSKAVKSVCGIAPQKAAASGTETEGTAILWLGPDRWLIVEKERRDLFAALAAKIAPDMAALTDLGHARVCWRIDGPKIRDLFAKGSSFDFDPSSFHPGVCIGTMMGHFAVILHCRAEDSADLYVARSYAVDLHEWLVESSLDLGLRITDPI